MLHGPAVVGPGGDRPLVDRHGRLSLFGPGVEVFRNHRSPGDGQIRVVGDREVVLGGGDIRRGRGVGKDQFDGVQREIGQEIGDHVTHGRFAAGLGHGGRQQDPVEGQLDAGRIDDGAAVVHQPVKQGGLGSDADGVGRRSSHVGINAGADSGQFLIGFDRGGIIGVIDQDVG